jgi:hypothetical protein
VSFQRYMIGWVYDVGWLLVHICNPATILSTRCVAHSTLAWLCAWRRYYQSLSGYSPALH